MRAKHRFEYAILKGFEVMFRALPLDAASALGGFLVEAVAPHLKKHTIADRQLRAIFPEWTAKKRQAVLKRMWNNLGRTAAEFLSFKPKLFENMNVIGAENLAPAGVAAIYLTGHMGNWELLPSIVAKHGTPMVVLHRQASNPLSATLIDKKRMMFAHSLASKSTHGVAQIVRAMKDKRCTGILVDFRSGGTGSIDAPFLGLNAKTSTLPAELALKYGARIIPTRMKRRHDAYFDAYIYPAIEWEPTGDTAADVAAITTKINAIYESWIRETPEQWLWFHERFGKGKF